MTPQQAIDLLKVHYPNSSMKIGAEVWAYERFGNAHEFRNEIDLYICGRNARFTGKTLEECVTQAIAVATAPKIDSSTTPENFIAAAEQPEAGISGIIVKDITPEGFAQRGITAENFAGDIQHA
jgi:hypothetical protein